jgi:ribose transport system ATP-binding protein
MENFSIPNLSYFSTGGFLNRSKESKAFAKYVKSMKLPLHCASRMSNTLSGGNQQKLLFARWLCRQCDVILLDEPTRGIDIAARYEIYQLVRTLTDQGKSIVMVSSDLAEVIGMANRILVMRDGAVAGELDNLNNLSQSDVLALAYGATDAAKRS